MAPQGQLTFYGTSVGDGCLSPHREALSTYTELAEPHGCGCTWPQTDGPRVSSYPSQAVCLNLLQK